MIPIFIGSSKTYKDVEGPMEYAIRKHASVPVDVRFMRPGERGLTEAGCTGFTMFRYAIPELCGYMGHAIYLDIDMLLLGDIAELWEYKKPGTWACLVDGSNEVMVIDCTVRTMPPIRELHNYKKWDVYPPLTPCIPLAWNSEDEILPDAKLIHYTDLSRQPYFVERTDPAALLWYDNVKEYDST